MLTIKTNHQFRNLIYGYELTDKERAEFDYIDDIDSHNFFRYRGIVYDPDEFMRIPDCANQRLDPDLEPMLAWDGYQSDSYFSGVLVKYSDDFEQIKVATYYS